MDKTRPDRTWTYAEIAAKASSVRSHLSSFGLNVNPASALGLVLHEADLLSEEWDNGTSNGGLRRLINAAHANRIADAILASNADPGAGDCLERIAKSNMYLSSRDASQGKDALWEIDLGSYLKRNGIDVLHSEPDLMVDFGFGAYPIACKKVYSEKNFEVQMRKGAQQLFRTGKSGIVAINLDDLVPEDTLLQSSTQAGASDFLADFNHAFIDRHRAKIQRFIVDKRCDGILVSTTTLADIVHSSPRFNTHTQTTLWSLDSIDMHQAGRIAQIRVAMGA